MTGSPIQKAGGYQQLNQGAGRYAQLFCREREVGVCAGVDEVIKKLRECGYAVETYGRNEIYIRWC